MTAPDQWTEEAVTERLRDLFADEEPLVEHQGYVEAAAVLAVFDLERLRPIGSAAADPGEARTALADLSEPAFNDRNEPCRALRRDVRRRALARLVEEHRVEAALQANPDRDAGIVQLMLEAVLDDAASAADTRRLDELRALQLVADWLDGLVPGLPDRETLRARVERESLLLPFRELVGDYFAGRERELAALSDYADILEASSAVESLERRVRSVFSFVEEPPLFLYGPGGIGKSTLVAKFILDHVDRSDVPPFPFAYLDFDRPGLVAEEPITLLVETLRQLSTQYPDARADIEGLQRDWTTRIHRTVKHDSVQRPTAWASLRLADRDHYLETFAQAVLSLQHGPQPMLLVVDTFEEVQLRSTALVGEIFTFLEQIQRRLPFVRTVLSGRVASAPPGLVLKELPLGSFDIDAATAYLTQRARVDAATAAAVAKQVTGSPLTLKLAADLLNKERAGPKGFEGLSTGFIGSLWHESIEAQLYTRVLKHIRDEEVRKLAHPGLVLRRITPDIINTVLAEPCGIPVPDEAAAQALFAKLRAEVVLVTQAAPDVLVHRPDLRAVMLESLTRADPSRVQEIHRRAVAYYEAGPDTPESRAEEIYHRLALGFDRAVLEDRWTDEAGKALVGALPELPPQAQAFLAARLGLDVSPEIWAQADQQDWEAHVIREGDEYLRVNKPDQVLTLLDERAERTANSALYLLRVQTLMRLGRVGEAREAADRAMGDVVAGSRVWLSLEQYVRTMYYMRRTTESGTKATEQIRRLSEAIRDGFASRQQLAEVLSRFDLPADAEQLASGGDAIDLTTISLASHATEGGWLAPLVLALRRANPENLRLWRFAQEVGLTAHGHPESDAEGFAAALRVKARPADLRRSLTILEGQVCRVEVNNAGWATGLLVGPDLVLTSAAIFGNENPDHLPAAFGARMTAIFDQWVTSTDVAMPGVECRLSTEWLVVSASHERSGAGPGLGYALLRLDRRMGDSAGAQHGRRGWMTLTRHLEIEPKSMVATLRFDSRRALNFSYAATGMGEIDRGAARVRYEVDGDAGGSGSPVFDGRFSLVAIHLGREGRSWLPSLSGRRRREGVPADTVAQDLAARGVELPDLEPPRDDGRASA